MCDMYTILGYCIRLDVKPKAMRCLSQLQYYTYANIYHAPSCMTWM